MISKFPCLATCVFILTVLADAEIATGADAVSAEKLTTLHDYLSRARDANPQLQAFRARYEAASKRIPQVSALPDPMLQVTHFAEAVQTRTGPQENALMLSQRIPWFGKLSSRKHEASAEAEALWYAYQNRQLLLARRVAVDFYEYGFTAKALNLTEQNLNLLDQLEPVVEEKVRAGGALNQLLRLKVEIGMLSDKLQSLKNKRIAQSAELSALLDLPDGQTLPAPDWQEPPTMAWNIQNMEELMEAENLELKILERKMASALVRKEIARLESYPDITLGINYIQIDDPIMNTPDAGKDPWGVTVSVNLPIWPGKNRAAREEAAAVQVAVQSEYDDKLNELRAQLMAAAAMADDANRRLELYGKELLDLAQQAAENSRTSYESGGSGILDVIDSDRSLLEIRMLYWRAAADAWQQRIIVQTLANQHIQSTDQPSGK